MGVRVSHHTTLGLPLYILEYGGNRARHDSRPQLLRLTPKPRFLLLLQGCLLVHGQAWNEHIRFGISGHFGAQDKQIFNFPQLIRIRKYSYRCHQFRRRKAYQRIVDVGPGTFLDMLFLGYGATDRIGLYSTASDAFLVCAMAKKEPIGFLNGDWPRMKGFLDDRRDTTLDLENLHILLTPHECVEEPLNFQRPILSSTWLLYVLSVVDLLN
jgi:hypothetical protein